MFLKENCIAFVTMFRREITRIVRIWPQTLLPPVITMSLYFVIFGNLIGTRIGNMQGVSYINYIAPGLIMMSIITNAYANTVSSFFGSKFQKNIEEMLVAPITDATIIFGYMSGGVFRGLVVGILVAIVSLLFIDLNIHRILVTLLVAILTAVLFSLAGILNGIFARKFDDITIIPTFVLTPLTYLGGIFYSIDLLPSFWQKATLVNPIFYMVNGFRYGILGNSDVSINNVFIVLLIFIMLLYFTCSRLIQKGVGIRS
ncbi:MAG: ABC transporter permease [Romboutsia sp.]|nr:ABC transporter permease [Romboutsia sp.]